MINTTLRFFVTFIILFLIFGIFVQHLFSKPQSIKSLICNEGKLLSQVVEKSSVYTKVDGLACVNEKGLLIIKDKKDRVALVENYSN